MVNLDPVLIDETKKFLKVLSPHKSKLVLIGLSFYIVGSYGLIVLSNILLALNISTKVIDFLISEPNYFKTLADIGVMAYVFADKMIPKLRKSQLDILRIKEVHKHIGDGTYEPATTSFIVVSTVKNRGEKTANIVSAKLRVENEELECWSFETVNIEPENAGDFIFKFYTDKTVDKKPLNLIFSIVDEDEIEISKDYNLV